VITAGKSTGNNMLSHSSNSITLFLIFVTLWSTFLKSISVNSKNVSSTPSSSGTLAIPLTSISVLLSKHNPRILRTNTSNLLCY
jgi:hypothetical protein